MGAILVTNKQIQLLKYYVQVPYELLRKTEGSSFPNNYKKISTILGSKSEAEFVILGKRYLNRIKGETSE